MFTSACFFFLSFFSFLSAFLYPSPVGDSQRGKRETIEQAHILSEGQKKMVRFWGHSLEEDAEWGEPQVKDSGVDTCSSTTLNEDHSHSEKVPAPVPACTLSLSSSFFFVFWLFWVFFSSFAFSSGFFFCCCYFICLGS